MATWHEFPYDNDDFIYDAKALKKHWKRLHESDREAFPNDDDLVEAWRLYHAGEFQAAAELGDDVGINGAFVANKATGIYATYLEGNEKKQLKLFEACVERSEEALEEQPDKANNHYIYAFALGRYSQGISITKALAKGYGGKIKEALERCLKIDPKHADAHVALGLYHAEIIDKVGAMVGKLTYGANAKDAKKFLQQAIKLAPNMAIAKIEYANTLLMLDGDKAMDEATELYVAASEMEPADAMECLDIEMAKEELEE